MIGSAKLANKMCTAPVATMNSTNKTSVGKKHVKPYYIYLNSCRERKCGIV